MAPASDAGRLARPHATLAYSTTGPRRGPLAVHAHGALSSRAHERRAGLFDWTAVTATHRLARYDARGHGESTGRAVPADYHYPVLADDLLALCDHLSPDAPVTGFGASMGTATVLWAALARPERFDRLVLAVPAVAWAAREPRRSGLRAAATLVERRGRGALDAAAKLSGPPAVLARAPQYTTEFDLAEPLLPAALRAAAASDLPAPEALRALPHPTLLLAWDTDPLHPLTTARTLAAYLPNARLHVADTLADIRSWDRLAAGFLAGERPAPR
ncbi:alpha/beta hydrolase family protein [Kitasatospora sp. SolWspMP-SS2h]|uniref:alpha/beta fold hydrolase n=1 Tax=Kitasatospora sp. SolWspMP-SS2h TaxID=1305729 RepID=UPI000DB98513|nr:alpha/beta fold hydrolase [Kitasatospora sp. SolWspMP-SS2h]RAJ34652.1 alpha/beta hydrolase family protein [Kitasatospora sp. SolWspMP-SS2h]